MAISSSFFAYSDSREARENLMKHVFSAAKDRFLVSAMKHLPKSWIGT